MRNKIDWKLYLVADVEYAGKKDLLIKTRQAVKNGVTLVQLRAKKSDSREFLELAVSLIDLLGPLNIPLIINDRIDIALACNADGVHLGRNDMPLAYARKILGIEKIIGISVNNAGQAEEAETGGADYLGASPVFYTASKEDLDPELGTSGIKNIREKVSLPIVAIGGINAQNAAAVWNAGADGLAVISAILGAEDIPAATRILLSTINY